MRTFTFFTCFAIFSLISSLGYAQVYDVRACLPKASSFEFDSPSGLSLDWGDLIKYSGTSSSGVPWHFFGPAQGVGTNPPNPTTGLTDGVFKIYVGGLDGAGPIGGLNVAYTDITNPNSDFTVNNNEGLGGKAFVYLSGLLINDPSIVTDDKECTLLTSSTVCGASAPPPQNAYRLDGATYLEFSNGGYIPQASDDQGVNRFLGAIVNIAIFSGELPPGSIPGISTNGPTFVGPSAGVFTSGDVPGLYTGTLTLTAVANNTLPDC